MGGAIGESEVPDVGKMTAHGGGTITYVGVCVRVVGSYNWHVASYTGIHTHMSDTYIGTDRLTGPFTSIYRPEQTVQVHQHHHT